MFFEILKSLAKKGPFASILVLCFVVVACMTSPDGPRITEDDSFGIHKIRHIIIIMQENRSFDEYFGTYPGADGIPTEKNEFAVCVPNPATGSCERPYHNVEDKNGGGPHGAVNALADVDHGKMDGFVRQAEAGQKNCSNPENPACTNLDHPDVMGYHDFREIPNYWAYAEEFVLQDRMFEPNASWSLPAHLFAVSEWSARCATHQVDSCVNELQNPGFPPDWEPPHPPPIYAWTDLTYVLHKRGVTWGYYVLKGSEPDCEDDELEDCLPVKQDATTPGIWNPLPYFDTVKDDDELKNIQSLENFIAQAQAGSLPEVSWIIPSADVSEHPPALVSAGQTFVTYVVNAIMKSPNWNDCVIFLAWDDWGGFYDHVVPVKVDENGYGLRVPGLVISPFAKHGFIDHQTLSFDAYVKFIEDDFLYRERLNPKTDDRPDPRPDVREDAAVLGDLTRDFDFSQTPRPPFLLPEHPRTDLVPTPPGLPPQVFKGPSR